MENIRRRRLLHLTGASVTAVLAGCSDDDTGGTTTEGTKASPSGSTTTDTTTAEPSQTLHTKYNSREKFASPGKRFETFEDPSNWEHAAGR